MGKPLFLPDDEWLAYIAHLWQLGSQMSLGATGEEMDGSMADLDRLQTIIDGDRTAYADAQALRSLDIVFGEVFVDAVPGYQWWIALDGNDNEVCLRYRDSFALTTPAEVLSDRIAGGEQVKVVDLFNDLREKLEGT